MALKPLEVLKKGLKVLKIVPISSLYNINVTDQDLLQMQRMRSEMLSTICKQLVHFSSKNKMDTEALLNPHEESQMVDGVRDEEICQAMLVMRNAQDEGPTRPPINGGDNDVEDDSPLAPCPTCHEVFWAASVINRYMC